MIIMFKIYLTESENRIFEDLRNKPQVGDYVICKETEYYGEFDRIDKINNFLLKNVG